MNKIDKNNMIYIHNFDTDRSAYTIQSYAYEIADKYGFVTLADMHDLIGTFGKFTDNLVGWTLDAVDEAIIKKWSGGYAFYMPQFNWRNDDNDDRDYPNCNRRACDSYEGVDEPQTEPINITIPFDNYLECPNLINDAIQALLKSPEKIADRPIFININ